MKLLPLLEEHSEVALDRIVEILNKEYKDKKYTCPPSVNIITNFERGREKTPIYDGSFRYTYKEMIWMCINAYGHSEICPDVYKLKDRLEKFFNVEITIKYQIIHYK